MLGARPVSAWRRSHAYRRDINVVLARAVRRLFAIALERVPADARQARRARFLRRARAHAGAARAAWTSSRAAASSSSRAISTCWWTSSRTPAARSGSWSRELMSSWAEGAGARPTPLAPSIFIVGDRKQSIYGFRDAEVAVLDEAARYIEALRPDRPGARRDHPELPCGAPSCCASSTMCSRRSRRRPQRPTRSATPTTTCFRWRRSRPRAGGALAIVAAASDDAQAEAVAEEIARLLATGATGARSRRRACARAVRPGDIAILFRTREGHRVFEQALARRRVPFYVYKGLGFFDADEIKDVLALLAFLADPRRSCAPPRFCARGSCGRRTSAQALAPRPGRALLAADEPPACRAASTRTIASGCCWRAATCRRWAGWSIGCRRRSCSTACWPSRRTRGDAAARRIAGAREPEEDPRRWSAGSRTAATPRSSRIVEHFSQLVAGGDESNAIIDAVDAVNLMTVARRQGARVPGRVHRQPQRGSGGGRDPIRVVAGAVRSDEDARAVGGDRRARERRRSRTLDAREAEESKRLLYVALTRARDRLYLCGVIDDERATGRGQGLARPRYLPDSLVAVFGGGPHRVRRDAGLDRPRRMSFVRFRTPGPEPVRWSARARCPSTRRLGTLLPSPPTAGCGRGLREPNGSRGSDMSARVTMAAQEMGSNPALGTLVHALLSRAYAAGGRRACARHSASRPRGSRPGCVGDVDRVVLDRAVVMVVQLLGHPELAARPGHEGEVSKCRIPGGCRTVGSNGA